MGEREGWHEAHDRSISTTEQPDSVMRYDRSAPSKYSHSLFPVSFHCYNRSCV